MSRALLVEGLRKRYGEHEVLKGVTLSAEAGDVIAIIGASGSGKSTLLRCINLLERPQAGRIVIGDEELALVPGRDGTLHARDARQLQRLRSRVAMVFQHFNLWAHMTALANVIEAPMQVLGLSREDALKSVTLYPAQILGVGDQVGSLEVGKWADIQITDGDPLLQSTKCLQVILAGRVIPMDDRQIRLFKKYDSRPRGEMARKR